MSELTIAYKPSAWQQEFHSLTVDQALGAGAAGPGKSLCLLMDCNARIVGEHKRMLLPKNHPLYIRQGRSVGWALSLRRTFPQLKQTIDRAKRIFEAMDPDVKYHERDTTFTFASGYKYQFGHCLNPDDWENYQSNQYDWIGFDELTQFTETQFDQICTRLRSSDPELMKVLFVRAMSNPMMRRESTENFVVDDPMWVRRRFVDPAPRGRKVIRRRMEMNDGSIDYKTRIYLPATLFDNPDPAYVRQYERQLQDKPDHMRQALIYGNWYINPDAFFGQWWMPDLHICEPFQIPREWPLFRSMDWGFKTQGVISWYAIDPEDTLYKIYELNFKLKRPRQVAPMVLDVEKKLGVPSRYGSRLTGPADNQLWEDKGDQGVSKAEEFFRAGVQWVKAIKTSRRRNAELLVSRMKDHHGGMTRPGFVVFSTCTETIKTVPVIGTDPKDSESPMDGGPDHWLDETLYACEYASRERPEIAREEEDRFADEEVEPIAAQGASFGYYR